MQRIKRKIALKSGTKLSKFHRKGMRLLRIWVPDTQRPEFAREVARQAKLLHGRPEEKQALAFIEAAFDWDKV